MQYSGPMTKGERALSSFAAYMANDNDEPPGNETPPWLQPIEETATEDEDTGSFAPRALMAGIAVSVLVLFGALVWFLYDQADAGGAPVLVRAPEGPVKVEPADRGGMDVPHRDKLVFNRVSGDRAAGDETLRPAAEEPLERPEVPALDSNMDLAGAAEPVVGGVTEAVPQHPSADNGNTKDLPADALPAENISVPAGHDVETQAATQSGAGKKMSALPDDQWAIQIAAFRQKRDAAQWMDDIIGRHRDIFGSLTSALVETQRDMATYYRVRFGTFPNRAAALAMCDRVKKVDLSCIVVAPR